jgi:uncharacterized damage-inducible protein DinB
VEEMLTLFKYNWMLRDGWFNWCSTIPLEELHRERVGGMGSIIQTLFHIVDIEQSWIGDLTGREEVIYNFNDYNSLEIVKNFSTVCRTEIEDFITNWNMDMDNEKLVGFHPDDERSDFTYGEVIRHVIAHEIHHIGHLSIWARESGYKPISPNFVGRIQSIQN